MVRGHWEGEAYDQCNSYYTCDAEISRQQLPSIAPGSHGEMALEEREGTWGSVTLTIGAQLTFCPQLRQFNSSTPDHQCAAHFLSTVIHQHKTGPRELCRDDCCQPPWPLLLGAYL
jgi:hypothetical protein